MSGTTGFDEASSKSKEDKSFIPEVEEVYISVFFDGTGNNMYEQVNKGNHISKLLEGMNQETTVSFAASPTLFMTPDTALSEQIVENASKKQMELFRYCMEDYELQKAQAEEDIVINEDRSSRDSTSTDDNGGMKYSNVAILRSLAKKGGPCKNARGKISINYNLYVEGSGKLWKTGSKLLGLGMGTGRTGVVGLVSKAVVFIHEYLRSLGIKENVPIHFAVFGFSRGSTCARLFSSLVVKGRDVLPREGEFKQYLPESKDYYSDGRVTFLDDYTTKTVDFMGIYDTVSSIGFLQKDDNSTNNGPAYHFFPNEVGDKTWYVNWLHGPSLQKEDIWLAALPLGIQILAAKAGLSGLSKFSWGDAKNNFHRFNVRDYGLYSPQHPNVKHTFHICAADEFRENFALVDLGKELEKCCTEVFVPGCHSDIGGGLMNDDVLDLITLRTAIAHKETKMVGGTDPRDFKKITSRISIGVMEQMGWLSSNAVITSSPSSKIAPAKTYSQLFMESMAVAGQSSTYFLVEEELRKRKREKDIKNGGIGQTLHSKEYNNKIEFKRFAKEGYSNITLEMMLNRAHSKEYGLENEKWPLEFIPSRELPKRFQVEGELKTIKEYLKLGEKMEEGKRYFKMPDEDHYRALRKNYLHFSCTDELNPEQGFLNISQWGANFGNPPNWKLMERDVTKAKDDYYLLCRIIYRGDREDNDLHYMNEYPKDL